MTVFRGESTFETLGTGSGTVLVIVFVTPLTTFVTSPVLGSDDSVGSGSGTLLRSGTPPTLGTFGWLGTLGTPMFGMFGIDGTPIFGSDGSFGKPGTDGALGAETPGSERAGAFNRLSNDDESSLALAWKPAAEPFAATTPFAGTPGMLTPCDVDADVEPTATVTTAAATSAEYAMIRGFRMTAPLSYRAAGYTG